MLTQKIIHLYPSLGSRNYRYYWSGQLVSLIGSWISRVGQAWLVYELTGSAFKLGLIGSLQFLPILFFSLFTGVLIDRLPKKRMLYLTQIVAALIAFVLAYLTLTDQVQFGHMVVLALLLGCSNALDMPLRQSYIGQLVDRAALPSAIALNSTSFNFARIAGPAIAGFLMAHLDIGWCFFINGVSYLVVLFTLGRVQEPTETQTARPPKLAILSEVKEGLSYIYHHPILFGSVMMLLYNGILAYNFNVLIPLLAKERLHLAEQGFGLLMSALGVGSLVGALIISLILKKRTNEEYNSIMTFSNFMMATLLISIGFASSAYFCASLLIIAGFFNLCFSVTVTSQLQMQTDEAHRGRVMSVHTLVFAGATPIGNFIVGTLAEWGGVEAAFFVTGTLILLILIARLITRHFCWPKKLQTATTTSLPLD